MPTSKSEIAAALGVTSADLDAIISVGAKRSLNNKAIKAIEAGLIEAGAKSDSLLASARQSIANAQAALNVRQNAHEVILQQLREAQSEADANALETIPDITGLVAQIV
jgi:hypothetical protein